MGKSGAILGLINNDKIIKFNEVNKDNKDDRINIKNGCITLFYNFNELVINLILSNLKYFVSNNKKQIKKIENHILKIDNLGIKGGNSFLIMEKIGLSYKNNFYTNLNEIYIGNYIPKLITCVKNNDTKTLNEFSNFFRYTCRLFQNTKIFK